MKRILIWLLLAGMAISLCTVPVAAAEESNLPSMDAALVATLSDQLSSEEKALLGNREIYSESMGSFEYQDQPVLTVTPFRIFRNFLEEGTYQSVREVMEHSEAASYRYYIILNENSYQLLSNTAVVYHEDARKSYTSPRYTDYAKESDSAAKLWQIRPYEYRNCVADWIRLGTKPEIFGTECTVERVSLFADFYNGFGAFFYYQTDRGNFVRYYPTSETKEGIWYTEEHFLKSIQRFIKYRIEVSETWNELNAVLIGGARDRLEFSVFPEIDQEDVDQDVKFRKRLLWKIRWLRFRNSDAFPWVVGGTVLILILLPCGVILLKKKKTGVEKRGETSSDFIPPTANPNEKAE